MGERKDIILREKERILRKKGREGIKEGRKEERKEGRK
jgi:hypothetical protein